MTEEELHQIRVAMEMVSAYCAWHKCDECPFYYKWPDKRRPCLFAMAPLTWVLYEIGRTPISPPDEEVAE